MFDTLSPALLEPFEFAEFAWGAAGAGSGADDGQNMLVVVMAAITPSTASAISSFRFSTPSFT